MGDEIKKCAFCQHPKGYHYDEPIKGATQLPCDFPWDKNGHLVRCSCYGWCKTEEEAESWRRKMNDLTGLAAYHDGSFYNLAVCLQCGHMKSMHIGRCKQVIENRDHQYECGCNQMFSGGGQEYSPERDGEPIEPGAKKARVVLFKPSGKYYTEEEWRIPENAIGPYDMERSPDFHRISGGHVLIETQEPWGFPHLFPSGPWAPTTKAELSSSYSKSAQSERSSQYEERQSLSHFQCKYQHGRIVEVQLVHKGSTLVLNPREVPELNWGQLFRILPALLTCEEAECRDAHILVEQVLSSLLLVLESSLPIHKEHYSSPPSAQLLQPELPENLGRPRRAKKPNTDH